MKKFAYVAVAAFAAFLVTLVLQSSAQAYPEVQISLTASKVVVNGGENVTATATANVDCTWNESWNGDSRASAGNKFVTTYAAPNVTRITKIALVATCEYVAPQGAARAGVQTWKHQLTITVLPAANGAAAAPRNSANLPNEGGPNRVFLLSGLVLLLAGATAVTVARRRAEAELPAQTA